MPHKVNVDNRLARLAPVMCCDEEGQLWGKIWRGYVVEELEKLRGAGDGEFHVRDEVFAVIDLGMCLDDGFDGDAEVVAGAADGPPEIGVGGFGGGDNGAVVEDEGELDDVVHEVAVEALEATDARAEADSHYTCAGAGTDGFHVELVQLLNNDEA